MPELNQTSLTSVTEFLLLGFTNVPHLSAILFVVFLVIYLITLLGNLGIILIIQLDPHLHTPMYFFLSNLSLVDLCCSSAIAPKTMVNFLSENKAISYLGCATQLYFFVAFAGADSFLLAAMAYDRYTAICKPFLYPLIMTRRLCIQLAVCIYFASFLNSLITTCITFRLSFCSSNEINHFFCDVNPLMKLSCMDTHINDILLPIIVGSVVLSSILVILGSYMSIIFTILRMHIEGRSKAFSTCTSHFISVTLFYGTALFMYMRPSSSYFLERDMVVSVFYTVAIPMLNPLIYSLRNQEVKAALRKIISRNIFSQKVNSMTLIH
ncbi:olfactory receptor 1020-like [Microcaecilia unicolor]|uniref:Olfactory receptor n=1 Tax=Microcaecilia unicolor TaxID=1415580 RepID=A0A6P7X6D6_9AMPH|nr:olfactory receptor 1020-like [Microcaecilia unicolor]